jgi:hypothetical protein
VSKRRGAAYRSGECRDWRKVQELQREDRERRRVFVNTRIAKICLWCYNF